MNTFSKIAIAAIVFHEAQAGNAVQNNMNRLLTAGGSCTGSDCKKDQAAGSAGSDYYKDKDSAASYDASCAAGSNCYKDKDSAAGYEASCAAGSDCYKEKDSAAGYDASCAAGSNCYNGSDSAAGTKTDVAAENPYGYGLYYKAVCQMKWHYDGADMGGLVFYQQETANSIVQPAAMSARVKSLNSNHYELALYKSYPLTSASGIGANPEALLGEFLPNQNRVLSVYGLYQPQVDLQKVEGYWIGVRSLEKNTIEGTCQLVVSLQGQDKGPQ